MLTAWEGFKANPAEEPARTLRSTRRFCDRESMERILERTQPVVQGLGELSAPGSRVDVKPLSAGKQRPSGWHERFCSNSSFRVPARVSVKGKRGGARAHVVKEFLTLRQSYSRPLAKESTTMPQSRSQRPSFPRPLDVLSEDEMSCGAVRFSILSWGWRAVRCTLALVLVYVAVGTSRHPDEADHSLLGKHIKGVESVAFNPGGRWLASAGGDTSAYLWDLERGELAKVLDRIPESAETLANRVAFAPNGSTLAGANDDGSVTLWDVASGIEQHHFRASARRVRCLAFSPDSLLLATASTDHSIALWDVATLSRRAVLLGSSRSVNCVVFSPDGLTLASACMDGTAKLWDVSSGENIRTLTMTTTKLWSVICVAYSPDGRMLATACPESGVALWHASSGSRLITPWVSEGGALTLAFSPRGQTLAWGTAGGMIEIWDAGGNRRLSVGRGHSGAVMSLAFSPDGRTLASGGNDAAVRVWEVPEPADACTFPREATMVPYRARRSCGG